MQAPRPVISQIVFQESVISRITFINDSKFDPKILTHPGKPAFREKWMSFPEFTNKGFKTTWRCLVGRFRLKIVFLFEISIINFGSIRSLCTVCIHCRLKFRVEFFCRIKFLKCWCSTARRCTNKPFDSRRASICNWLRKVFYTVNRMRWNLKWTEFLWTYLRWNCIASTISIIKHWP